MVEFPGQSLILEIERGGPSRRMVPAQIGLASRGGNHLGHQFIHRDVDLRGRRWTCCRHVVGLARPAKQPTPC